MLALAIIATLFVVFNFVNVAHMVNEHNRLGIRPSDLLFGLVEYGFVIVVIWVLYSKIP